MKTERKTPLKASDGQESKSFSKLSRRNFLKKTGTVLAGAAVVPAVSRCRGDSKPPPSSRNVPDQDRCVGTSHHHIDQDRCVGCGQCVPLCPMGAISLEEGKSRIDCDECAECGVCNRSMTCPVDAIRVGELTWPRVLRAKYSNPVSEHESTGGVPGRGEEGIKTNDSRNRFRPGEIGVFLELGRPVLGARFRDAEKAVMVFKSHGYGLMPDNPVMDLVDDPLTGGFKPEVLNEKVISCLVSFVLPMTAARELIDIIHELEGQVESCFNVSVVLSAREDGLSPFDEMFGPDTFRLPWTKINLGLAAGIGKADG